MSTYVRTPIQQEWVPLRDFFTLHTTCKSLHQNPKNIDIINNKAENTKYKEYLSTSDQETITNRTNLQGIGKALKREDAISRVMERFLDGELIYRPNPNSDEGMIKLPFRAIGLEGEFDLSKCGEDAAQHLSIHTGYRKWPNAQDSKYHVWIGLTSLIEKDLPTTAAHFQPIMEEIRTFGAPITLVFTAEIWSLKHCVYLPLKFDTISRRDLHAHWLKGADTEPYFPYGSFPEKGGWSSKNFHVSFLN